MNILIVGLGSMGKRRARLLKGIDPSVQLWGVDNTEFRRAEAAAGERRPGSWKSA